MITASERDPDSFAFHRHSTIQPGGPYVWLRHKDTGQLSLAKTRVPDEVGDLHSEATEALATASGLSLWDASEVIRRTRNSLR